MKRMSVFSVFLCLAAISVSGVGFADEESTDDPKDAHKALRDAVDEIRIQYSPKKWVYGEFLSRADMNRPGLGIVIKGGFSWPGETDPGAVILGVTPGSPAEEAGLRSGDVVTHWNGEPLSTTDGDARTIAAEASRELVKRSHELAEGDAVTLRYLRDGDGHEATMIARKVDFSPRLAAGFTGLSDFDFHAAPVLAGQTAEPWFLPRGWFDMELAAVNPELGEYFGSDKGVLVVRGPEGEETLGLESGDVILRIGDREVTSPEHAMRILRSYEPDEELTLHIIRHKSSHTLTGSVPATSFRFDYRFKWSGEED